MADEKRTELVGAKMKPSEKRKVARAAQRQGMDVSNYIRWKLIYKDMEGGGGQ